MSLYHKYRPRRFSDLVGQSHIVRIIRNAVKTGELNHAYLFCGPRGSGKTSLARVLTRSLNCLEPVQYEPCLKCENCRHIEQGSYMDLIEIDAASNRRVEDIRDLKEKVIFAPQSGKYKVYIIDETHMLTREAFNAFLKILEEPPAHTIFILATTEPEKLPPTIISRCQRHNFHKVSIPEISEYLGKIWNLEKQDRQLGNISEDALLSVARLSDGAMRDAMSMLEQLCLSEHDITSADIEKTYGILPHDTCDLLLSLLQECDFSSISDLTDRIIESGTSVPFLINSLIDNLKEKLLKNENTQFLMKVLEQMIFCVEKLRWHPFPRQILDLAFLKIIFNSPAAETHAPQSAHHPVSAPKTIAHVSDQSPAVKASVSSSTDTKTRFEALIFNLNTEHPGLASVMKSARVKSWSAEKLEFSFATPFEFRYLSSQDSKAKISDTVKKLFHETPQITAILEEPASIQTGDIPPQVRKILDMFGGEVIEVKHS